MCFPYIIKHNFVANDGLDLSIFILLFTVFNCLASVIVGFGCFCNECPLKASVVMNPSAVYLQRDVQT